MENREINHLYYTFVERVGTLSNKLSKQGKFPAKGFEEVRELVNSKNVYQSFIKNYHDKEFVASISQEALKSAKQTRMDVYHSFLNYETCDPHCDFKSFLDFFVEDVVNDIIYRANNK